MIEGVSDEQPFWDGHVCNAICCCVDVDPVGWSAGDIVHDNSSGEVVKGSTIVAPESLIADVMISGGVDEVTVTSWLEPVLTMKFFVSLPPIGDDWLIVLA